jgi:hypothetical protein
MRAEDRERIAEAMNRLVGEAKALPIVAQDDHGWRRFIRFSVDVDELLEEILPAIDDLRLTAASEDEIHDMLTKLQEDMVTTGMEIATARSRPSVNPIETRELTERMNKQFKEQRDLVQGILDREASVEAKHATLKTAFEEMQGLNREFSIGEGRMREEVSAYRGVLQDILSGWNNMVAIHKGLAILMDRGADKLVDWRLQVEAEEAIERLSSASQASQASGGELSQRLQHPGSGVASPSEAESEPPHASATPEPSQASESDPFPSDPTTTH